ncbi:MAG TPA: hypothetical protein DCZ95_12350 [Verrucomicrobia bacterium]|nr:MAG: hypothetical protein A2X46_14395 [Lentisphaerae bacterium GWF2_57_35]HBA84876.1 hypothetical protein [Verrucomicrobiota bacterium]
MSGAFLGIQPAAAPRASTPYVPVTEPAADKGFGDLMRGMLKHNEQKPRAENKPAVPAKAKKATNEQAVSRPVASHSKPKPMARKMSKGAPEQEPPETDLQEQDVSIDEPLPVEDQEVCEADISTPEEPAAKAGEPTVQAEPALTAAPVEAPVLDDEVPSIGPFLSDNRPADAAWPKAGEPAATSLEEGIVLPDELAEAVPTEAPRVLSQDVKVPASPSVPKMDVRPDSIKVVEQPAVAEQSPVVTEPSPVAAEPSQAVTDEETVLPAQQPVALDLDEEVAATSEKLVEPATREASGRDMPLPQAAEKPETPVVKMEQAAPVKVEKVPELMDEEVSTLEANPSEKKPANEPLEAKTPVEAKTPAAASPTAAPVAAAKPLAPVAVPKTQDEVPVPAEAARTSAPAMQVVQEVAKKSEASTPSAAKAKSSPEAKASAVMVEDTAKSGESAREQGGSSGFTSQDQSNGRSPASFEESPVAPRTTRAAPSPLPGEFSSYRSAQTAATPSAAQVAPGAGSWGPSVNRIERLHELMERLDEHVVSLAAGKEKTMSITLSPESLGKVVLNCREQGGQMIVEIVAETQVVKNLLQQQESSLRHVLEQSGYKMGAFDVRTQDGHSDRRPFERQQAHAEDAMSLFGGTARAGGNAGGEPVKSSAWKPAGAGGIWVVA